jgi:predicted kinase
VQNSGRLILMCGRSFSGKSTVARDLGEQLDVRTVSFDEINEARGLFGGMGIPAEEWGVTHGIASARASELLAQGLTVIIDDTSSPRFLRDGWRARAADLGASFLLVFVDADRELILQRQSANRTTGERHDVADEVMAEHLDDFEPPEADEPVIQVRSEIDSLDEIAARVIAAFSQ